MGKSKARLGIEQDFSDVEVNHPSDKPPPWDLLSKFEVVGKPLPRLDGPVKSTGVACYTYDIQLEGMLHGKTLRSPFAAASVKLVNVRPALKVPGVVAAISVAPRKVRYVGEELAVVAAETEAAALAGIAAIEFELDPLPFVVEAEAGRQEGAPQVFLKRENVRKGRGVDRGDVDAAIAEGDAVIEAVYETQSQLHTCLESHGSVARWEPDGSLTVWTSTQATFGVRRNLSERFGLKQSQVRVICEHMGGGFGSKFAPGPFTFHAAELAKQAARPVKIMLDRREELLIGGSRPDSHQRVTFAARSTGELTGAWVVSRGTGGLTGGTGVKNPAIYDFGSNVRTEHEDVYTNRAASCAFRAPGHPQGVFALESAMDELADKLKIDPLEFRRRNDSNPVRNEQYSLGAEAIGWDRRRSFDPTRQSDGPMARGFGMASSLWYASGRPGWKVAVEIHQDGSVVVKNGAQDLGTGTRTILAMCVAEELGIHPDKISVQLGDTNLPSGPGSGGSTTAPSLAPAARDAGYMAANELKDIVAAASGLASKDLFFRDGHLRSLSKPKGIMSFAEAAAMIQTEVLSVSAARDPNYEGYRDTCAGVQFAEVLVDTETGVVKVEKIVALQDAGIVLNPMTFRSQVTGGVIGGLSYALFEDRILDPTTGGLVNADLLTYKIAGMMDMPEIQVLCMDVANGKNSTSTMGVGEPPAIPTAGAIANAVANACGARVRSLPITPWKVLEAMGKI